MAALMVANTLQTALALWSLRRVGVGVRPTYDNTTWRLLLRKGRYGIPSSIGQALTFRVDRYLVGLFLNPAAVAIYSVAATAPELLRLPSLALGQPLVYRFASGSASLGDFRRVRRLCLAMTVLMAAAIAVAAPLLIRIAFGSEYLGAVTPLRVLLLGELGICMFYLNGATLTGINKLKEAAIAATIGLGIVVLLDLVLIPVLGLAGAAWASVIAYSAMGAAAAFLVRRSTAQVGSEERLS